MSAQSSGLVAAAKQNEAGGATPHNVSVFPLSYSFYNTERFGELTPFHVEEAVSGDKLPLHSSHELRTYTLEAPLMQSLLKKKDFFYVPMQAILPLNWEKFYTNPVIGEDVPVDVGCGVEGFWKLVGELFSSTYQLFSAEVTTYSDTQFLENLIKFMVFFEYFYSTGSLMESLGISGHNFIHVTSIPPGVQDAKESTFDDFFDACAQIFADNLYMLCSIGGVTYQVSQSVRRVPNGPNYLSWREFWELVRDDLATFGVTSVSMDSNPSFTTFHDVKENLLHVLSIIPLQGSAYPEFYFSPVVDSSNPLNLSRLWAYQLVCAHFYSNDHVDFVYSAELFRQYIQQLVSAVAQSAGSSVFTFSVNGFTYQYDSLSASYTHAVFANFSGSIYGGDSESIAYFTALLHYKHSLRYMDYFTGARTRPLAIGDASVDVADSKVDVLDLSRSRMMAKFLQAVNRSGRKFGAYMKELFGKVPAPDYHNPFYLAHTSDVVGSSENQNTAEGQRSANAFTSNFITNASRFAFTFHPDRDCIVLGISYYDIPRVYTRATERQNFFVDRFDMFNPYMQFIGDQPIYTAEIGTDSPTTDPATPFGYQNRHMEYKQRYNQAAGAFANPSSNLQNWIFVSDMLRRQVSAHQSSSFIRSFNSELDHFYTSLTGWSNGSYFHFICRYDNRQDATRPMAYAPVIA